MFTKWHLFTSVHSSLQYAIVLQFRSGRNKVEYSNGRLNSAFAKKPTHPLDVSSFRGRDNNNFTLPHLHPSQAVYRDESSSMLLGKRSLHNGLAMDRSNSSVYLQFFFYETLNCVYQNSADAVSHEVKLLKDKASDRDGN